MKNKGIKALIKTAILSPAFLALSAFAQTSTTTPTTTPGVPSTGAGGDLILNLALIGIAGAAIILGTFQAKRAQ